jgi:hypothetical protein
MFVREEEGRNGERKEEKRNKEKNRAKVTVNNLKNAFSRYAEAS